MTDELTWAWQRAQELANLERRDYSIWSAPGGRLTVTSAREGDERQFGHMARVTPAVTVSPAPAPSPERDR